MRVGVVIILVLALPGVAALAGPGDFLPQGRNGHHLLDAAGVVVVDGSSVEWQIHGRASIGNCCGFTHCGGLVMSSPNATLIVGGSPHTVRVDGYAPKNVPAPEVTAHADAAEVWELHLRGDGLYYRLVMTGGPNTYALVGDTSQGTLQTQWTGTGTLSPE